MQLKTSELINKLVSVSENSLKCEDENFNRFTKENIKDKMACEPVTYTDVMYLLRASTEYSRFAYIRTTCKILQDLGIVENDVDVFNNEDFRNALAKAYHV